MPDAPGVHKIMLSGNPEEDAGKMREYLGISATGPVGNLIQLLENRGILVHACDIENDAFSGMHGQVNGRPYIIYNKHMSPERIRYTIAHEMAHFIFVWPEDVEEREIEKRQLRSVVLFFFQRQMQKENPV